MRPFKNIAEFVEKTGFNVGMVIKTVSLHKKEYESVSVITNFDCYANQMYFGERFHPFVDLFKSYEYFKDGKWLRFGVEETNNRPAKFKTGKKYYDYGYEKFEVLINTKYKDPDDNKVKVILNGATISEVFTDNEGNERATILDDIVKAEDEVKENAQQAYQGNSDSVQ